MSAKSHVHTNQSIPQLASWVVTSEGFLQFHAWQNEFLAFTRI